MSEFVGDVNARKWGEEVLGSEVPVLVNFGADWCGPCHMVSPILEEIAKERAGQMKVLKLDVDQYPEVAAEHGVRSIPTLALFSGGAERGRVVGVLPKRHLETELDKAMAPMGPPGDEAA
jgi:thioredoxin 1